MFLASIGVAIAGALLYANLPAKYIIGYSVPSINYLRTGRLIKIKSEKDVLSSSEIEAGSIIDNENVLVFAIRRPGCALCRKEGKDLVAIKPELQKRDIRLIGVVHEYKGVDGFREFFDDCDIYYDVDKKFYGPKERWMPTWVGFLRPKLWINYKKSKDSGVEGNLEGEGRLLGGVYLITKGKMIYSHLEQEWGDWANTTEILEAVKKLD
uniref:Peroxiredoxin-like 2A n=1 Tax=Strongyloides venezuelensis TaxID=75913 RepID=A0A0K0F1E4_STRVS